MKKLHVFIISLAFMHSLNCMEEQGLVSCNNSQAGSPNDVSYFESLVKEGIALANSAGRTITTKFAVKQYEIIGLDEDSDDPEKISSELRETKKIYKLVCPVIRQGALSDEHSKNLPRLFRRVQYATQAANTILSGQQDTYNLKRAANLLKHNKDALPVVYVEGLEAFITSTSKRMSDDVSHAQKFVKKPMDNQDKK